MRNPPSSGAPPCSSLCPPFARCGAGAACGACGRRALWGVVLGSATLCNATAPAAAVLFSLCPATNLQHSGMLASRVFFSQLVLADLGWIGGSTMRRAR